MKTQWKCLHEIDGDYYSSLTIKKFGLDEMSADNRRKFIDANVNLLRSEEISIRNQIQHIYATLLNIKMFEDWFEGWKREGDMIFSEYGRLTQEQSGEWWFQPLKNGEAGFGNYLRANMKVAEFIILIGQSFPLYVGEAKEIQILKG